MRSSWKSLLLYRASCVSVLIVDLKKKWWYKEWRLEGISNVFFFFATHFETLFKNVWRSWNKKIKKRTIGNRIPDLRSGSYHMKKFDIQYSWKFSHVRLASECVGWLCSICFASQLFMAREMTRNSMSFAVWEEDSLNWGTKRSCTNEGPAIVTPLTRRKDVVELQV
jgi:hypothetical protein